MAPRNLKKKTSIAGVLGDLKPDSLARSSRRSEAWFENKLKHKDIDKRTMVTRPSVGRMFIYSYDPKYKAVLPVYDRFPLVMPFGMYNNGWIGLNFHYLAPKMRFILLNELMKINGRKELLPKARLQLSWELLKKASLHRLVAPTVHRYLYSHTRGKLVKVPNAEWSFIISMPIAKFVGKSKMQVYADSRRSMR